MKINRFFGTLLCFFPGAAHLYLGLKKQGVQLMALFLLPMFVTELIRISGLMFILPIIWFYAFFDGLRKINGHDELIDRNIAIFDWVLDWYYGKHHGFSVKNKAIAYCLIGLGVLMILERILMPIVLIEFGYRVREYLYMGFVSLLLIGGGVMLLKSGIKEEEGEKKW
ncbi:hypothetical protein [Alkaliphilus hydrothermalis]|uniref:TM2 domain-containing protein n=1 Tax=Alkaliphilus hydrothermalis TaxID=1482730 RepID=A0ABS2NP15_9FIRM|nr:hypothetical protein [Alkaliphilus hydrothermalis]MBM7614319.1 hypothetical protein [Alkaliphilus hydrothermalis]